LLFLIGGFGEIGEGLVLKLGNFHRESCSKGEKGIRMGQNSPEIYERMRDFPENFDSIPPNPRSTTKKGNSP
jgi:hypothetical protein